MLAFEAASTIKRRRFRRMTSRVSTLHNAGRIRRGSLANICSGSPATVNSFGEKRSSLVTVHDEDARFPLSLLSGFVKAKPPHCVDCLSVPVRRDSTTTILYFRVVHLVYTYIPYPLIPWIKLRLCALTAFTPFLHLYSFRLHLATVQIDSRLLAMFFLL